MITYYAVYRSQLPQAVMPLAEQAHDQLEPSAPRLQSHNQFPTLGSTDLNSGESKYHWCLNPGTLTKPTSVCVCVYL